LIALFSQDAGPAVEIIQHTPEILAATDQHDMPSVPWWWRGPMIIIGDAAHAASPSSGQGVSMAIEDAVVLAKCLRDVPDSARAFAAFDSCAGHGSSGSSPSGHGPRPTRPLVRSLGGCAISCCRSS